MTSQWASPVASWLENGGFRHFELDNFARVFLLHSILPAVLPVEGRLERLLCALRDFTSRLASLDVDTFAESRTPFLMMAANRSLEMIANGDGEGVRAALASLLLHLFDSFFAHFEARTALEIDEVFAGQYVHLPALGLKIPIAQDSPTKLAKISDNFVSVSNNQGVCELAINPNCCSPAGYNFHYRDMGSGFTLLLENGPSLFEPEYAQKCYPDIPTPANFATLVADAVQLIFTVWPEIKTRFQRTIKSFVPIHQSEVRTHNSFSAQSMVGVIFLSKSYDDLKLVEAIVHEYHHSELYMLMQTDNLLSQKSSSKLYYSPWRADARPLFGLLHACYVFTAVAHYMRAAEECATDIGLATYFVRMRQQVIEKLLWGLAQIDTEDVTQIGRELVDWMRAEVYRHRQEYESCLFSAPSTDCIRHLNAWRQTYPSLAPGVRVPRPSLP